MVPSAASILLKQHATTQFFFFIYTHGRGGGGGQFDAFPLLPKLVLHSLRKSDFIFINQTVSKCDPNDSYIDLLGNYSSLDSPSQFMGRGRSKDLGVIHMCAKFQVR